MHGKNAANPIELSQTEIKYKHTYIDIRLVVSLDNWVGVPTIRYPNIVALG
jgi:hypothetical protein